MGDESLYPQIDVAGTPREMGLTHGRKLHQRIRKTVAMLREVVGEEAYLAGTQELQATRRYCEQHAGDLMEEVDGIAKGAGIALDDAFCVSAHLELLAWKRLANQTRTGPAPSECSSHAVVTERDVLLGWNGDDLRVWMHCGAVIRGRPSAGRPFIYWSLAGSVGRPGMGTQLALGANTLPSLRWRSDGLLYSMLSRRILAATSADEALDVFGSCNSCCGMNYLIADQTGELLDVEANADGFRLLKPEDLGPKHYLLHTNSYLHPSLVAATTEPRTECLRLAAARRLYAERCPTDADGLRAIQSDHAGGICVHREEACTIVSFVAQVRRQRFQVMRGNPCQASVHTYTLGDAPKLPI